MASTSEKIGEINATHLYKPATELRKKNRIKTIQSSLEIEGNTLTEETNNRFIRKQKSYCPTERYLRGSKCYISI